MGGNAGSVIAGSPVFVTALSLSFGVPGELCQESVPSWTFLHRGVEDSVAQGPDASGLNPDSAASLGLPEPQFAHLPHGPSSPLPIAVVGGFCEVSTHSVSAPQGDVVEAPPPPAELGLSASLAYGSCLEPWARWGGSCPPPARPDLGPAGVCGWCA